MLPKLVLLVVTVLAADAYPVGKEQSEFLRKVGAALGDLAAVVLEMNDPYVLERLSSKDQAHKFLVNFLQADADDVPRREFFTGVESDPYLEPPRRGWSYVSLRNLDGDTELQVDRDSDAEGSAADERSDASSSSSSEESEEYQKETEVTNDESLHPDESQDSASTEGVDLMELSDDSSDSASSSSSSSSSSVEESSEVDQPVAAEPRMYIPPKWLIKKKEVQSAEVSCSDEDESSEVKGKHPPSVQPGGRGLMEQVVQDHLWSLLAEATGKFEYQQPKKIHNAVDLHSRKIVVDLLRVGSFTGSM